MIGAVVSYVKPDKSGIQIYRIRFPSELVEFIPRADGGGMGRKELRVSLRAKDINDPGAIDRLQEAKAEYARIVAEAEKAKVAFEKRATGTFDDLGVATIAALAARYHSQELAADADRRKSTVRKDDAREVTRVMRKVGFDLPVVPDAAEWTLAIRTAHETIRESARSMRAIGDIEGITDLWGAKALSLASEAGFELKPGDSSHVALCEALHDAEVRASEDALSRLDGNLVPTPEPPAIPKRIAGGDPPPSSGSLLALFESYAAAQGISPGVRKEWRRYIAIFTEFLGHEDATRVSREDVVRWRDQLLVTTGRQGKERKPVTVRDKYLTALKCTLGWAKEERLLCANVASDVTVRVPRSAKLRDPNYTMDEAKKVLRASLEPPGPQLPPPSARARRWLPWLCAYSGARVGELAQLRKEDIKQEDGVWMMRVTPEAGSVKTKEARLVPIHDHIIEQGFLADVRRLSAGPMFYNPDNRRSPDDVEANRHIKKVGERLAKWVRETVGITDPAIKPNHAWRHLFSTLAEEAGIAERTYNAIQGHAPANAARKYGSTTAKAKAEAVKLFPRFDISE